MLRKLISKVRRQSPHVRSAVALWTAVGFTGVVALVWALHVPDKIAERQVNLEPDPNTPGITDFFSEVGDQAATAKAGLETAFEDEGSEPEPDPADNSLQTVVDQYQSAPPTSARAGTGVVATGSVDRTATTSSSTEEASPSSESAPRPVRIISRPSATTSSTTR